MATILSSQRRSGILAHITSLPSPYGIGDIGNASYDFLEFLTSCSQSCWQFLPLNPTNIEFDNSPYMSASAFAGSALLISPDLLFSDGLISRKSLEDHPEFSPYTTDYRQVTAYKTRLLREAHQSFAKSDNQDYDSFCSEHPWVKDHALFMALKEHFNYSGWFDWPGEAACRDLPTLKALRYKLRERIDYFHFEQYLFFRQWQLLRQKAKELGILLFGDIPIYVGLDSVDVWANQEIFALSPDTGRPTQVSGVPPDYFSDTGQRWGNPLYRWNSNDPSIEQQLLAWWTERFKAMFELVDIARIDHFRAFASYWAIPAENETAVEGKWLQGPGAGFFKSIQKELGPLQIVAEDLGIITEEVHSLRDELAYPGMKVLQFAFDGKAENPFLPHNYENPNNVVYTGTHDNDTTLGWFLSEKADDNLRERVKRLANRQHHDNSPINQDMIYLALSSISCLAIIPLQDILGFGSDCRMNRPGVAAGNWIWRCAPEFLSEEASKYMQSQTYFFGRAKAATPSS